MLLQKPVGEKYDILTEIEKELKIVAEYDDQLQMLTKYFTKKDPFKKLMPIYTFENTKTVKSMMI